MKKIMQFVGCLIAVMIFTSPPAVQANPIVVAPVHVTVVTPYATEQSLVRSDFALPPLLVTSTCTHPASLTIAITPQNWVSTAALVQNNSNQEMVASNANGNQQTVVSAKNVSPPDITAATATVTPTDTSPCQVVETNAGAD